MLFVRRFLFCHYEREQRKCFVSVPYRISDSHVYVLVHISVCRICSFTALKSSDSFRIKLGESMDGLIILHFWGNRERF